MTRCKAGDLAVIVRSAFGNEGKLVRVVGPCIGNSVPVGAVFLVDGKPWRKDIAGFLWVAESLSGPLQGEKTASMVRPIVDSFLRPIRDPGEDAVDESFRWVPSPAFERAYAETYWGGA
jgi:hypothetical protein